MSDHLLLTVFAVFGFFLLLYAYKKNGVGYTLLSALSGVAALFSADLVCGFFDFNLPLNAFTLCVSAAGGLPGVILLNILNVILK